LLSWYAPFFAYGLLAFPIALGVWFLVPEKQQGKRTSESIKEYWRKLKGVFKEKSRLLLSSYLVGMVALFLLFGVLSYVSDILESTYNLYGLKKGFVLAIPVLSMALTSYLSGLFFSDKQFLWKPIIVGGLLTTAITLGILPLFTNLVPHMATLFVTGISIGILLPPINSLITGATSTDQRGMITCLYGTVRFFGVAIGPPAFGLALELGKWPMFLGCAVIAASTAIIALVSITSPRSSE
ncbi:MAG TPA: MFS transporter, partial [Limnochordia bacterium]|nr:MFS transporter [Limnochordia bacterium]